MPQNSPNLDLPFLQPAQAQKHVTHNEALRRLDLVVQLRLSTIGATVPPATPDEGALHAPGAGATGAWAGQDGRLATWLDGAWQFLDPVPGWRAWDVAAATLVVWDGTAWGPPVSALDGLDRVGIGTSADAGNRLAVAAAATLLSHDGAGHQLKINKSAAADTASLLFQSGWTGHAEMGLAGNHAFAIKVSPDGSAWTEALRLDEGTGLAGGSAVQAGSHDGAPGRLMTVGAFGLGQTGTTQEAGDIDDAAAAAGLWRFGPGTAGAASLPAALAGTEGLLRIERLDAGRLRQSAWAADGAGGIWSRHHGGAGWGGWDRMLDRAAILGPVSQSGGQPTGALIERGSGPDGDYLRLADGTQICTAILTAATSPAWNFPAAFAALPAVQATARQAAAPRIVTENEDLSTTGVSFRIWDSAGAPASAGLGVTATGRWF